jgi:modification methylase
MAETRHRVYFADSRQMPEVEDESIHLIVTSPPYPMIEMWDQLFQRLNPQINLTKIRTAKKTQQEQLVSETYTQMHQALTPVWKESLRVLCPGGLLCINIGDATRTLAGTFRLFPNHARIIETCQGIGFLTLPYISWRKPTNRPNAFLGSGFLPTNGYVTLDLEQILIFRKGKPRHIPPHNAQRYASRFTKRERDSWFSQTWTLPGTAQKRSEIARRTAAYPLEVPRRLIRMFSILGDTILDPFLGTGTTIRAAQMLGRSSIGYELDEELRGLLKRELGEAVEYLAREKVEN